MKKIESDFTEFTAHLEKTSKDLSGINNTMLRKVRKLGLKTKIFSTTA